MTTSTPSSEETTPPTHTPGIFYVAARITSPHLPAASFETWYNTEHVPDILSTSGIKSAARYASLSPSAAYPYLAVYPCELEFLSSEEFMGIPFKSEKLSIEGCEEGKSFGVARFETRGYEGVAVDCKVGRKPGPGAYLATVLFDSAASTNERLAIECALLGLVPSRTRLFKLNFIWGRKEKGETGEAEEEPPKWLALHEFSEKEFSRDAFATAKKSMSAVVEGWELSTAFGVEV